MLDSPRPDRTMHPAIPGFRSDLISRTLARWVAPFSLPGARLRDTALLPLALLAFATSASAAGHHAAMPVHRAALPQVVRTQPSRAAHAAPRPLRESRSGRQAVSSAPSLRTRKPAAVAASAHTGRGTRGAVYAAATHSRHAEEVAAERAESKRSGKAGKGHAAYAAVQPFPQHLKHKGSVAPVSQDEEVADRRTSARIHAWYNRQASAPTVVADEATHARRPVVAAANTAPDLSLLPHKATTADFGRAAAAQRETIQAAAEQNQHQTTAADDNADAESHIPSTAPTERVPSPFIHGESLESIPANHSRNSDAPIVRQQMGLAPVQLARGISPQPASTVPPRKTVPVLAVVPQRVDLRGKSASSADGTPLNTAAPAVAALQSSARKPKLDAAVTEGMAEENFDDDGTPATPATARTAIALASAGPGAAVKKKSPAALDDTAPLASLTAVNVNLYDSSGHLQLVAPMKGSHEILVHQNQMALQDGLERIQNDYQLAQMRRNNLLVSLPDDDSVYPNDVLPLNRRYARPWTVRFLRDLARAHYARFGTPLIITSAARTVEFQRHLVRVNGNAAPPTGDIASPHLYGQAVDLGKRGMSLTELTWMRAYLTPVEADGKIDVEEEFQQACFHISVYRHYLGAGAVKPAQKLQVPTLIEAKAAPVTPAPEVKRRRLPTALLATGLR